MTILRRVMSATSHALHMVQRDSLIHGVPSTCKVPFVNEIPGGGGLDGPATAPFSTMPHVTSCLSSTLSPSPPCRPTNNEPIAADLSR